VKHGGVCLVLAGLAVPMSAALAQGGLVVGVVSAQAGAPVAGATVWSVRQGRAESTDRVGRARFPQFAGPDTLIVSAIGFSPDTLVVSGAVQLLRVSLRARPIVLAEVTVLGERQDATPTDVLEWNVPRAAVAGIPAAVEPDPVRALAVVPAVSFSTPLSARPLIRGYDAADQVIRVDGFDILNPYHIGRVFSSFPADATESVGVSGAPTFAADGGTLAGIVDWRGRSSGGGGVTGGLDLSLVSASGWLGTNAPFDAFVATRAAFISGVTGLVSNEGVPYNFQDAYAHSHVALGARRSWDVTVFGSHDDLSSNGQGLTWSNALVGQRLRVLDRPAASVDVSLWGNRFALDGNDVVVRYSQIDLSNRFANLGGAVIARVKGTRAALSLGAGVASYDVSNHVDSVLGTGFAPSINDVRTAELYAFAQPHVEYGALAVDVGLRLDESATAEAWQPRIRVATKLGRGAFAALVFSRAARPYQVITDLEPEPTLIFNDFWLNAGRDSVPVPRVDHLAGEVNGSIARWTLHVAAFVSSGSGLGELRPTSDQRTTRSPFRFGESRTRGLELQIGHLPASPNGLGAILTYVLSRSERRWEDGLWVPWRLDRTHALRLQLDKHVATRWRVFAAGELLSGQPLTRVAEVVRIEALPPDADTTGAVARLRYVYGPENGARSGATFHLDLGARVTLGGPGRSVIQVGASVINLTFGPVAPDEAVPPNELLQANGTYVPGGVPYRRKFELPAIPSLTARVEF
jgi:hypothetical protein